MLSRRPRPCQAPQACSPQRPRGQTKQLGKNVPNRWKRCGRRCGELARSLAREELGRWEKHFANETQRPQFRIKLLDNETKGRRGSQTALGNVGAYEEYMLEKRTKIANTDVDSSPIFHAPYLLSACSVRQDIPT